MATSITAGYLSTVGGSCFVTSGGTRVAVFMNSSMEVVAYTDVDSSPSLIGAAQTSTMINGGSKANQCVRAAIDSNDIVHVVVAAADTTTSYDDVMYNTISDPDSSPAWGTWERVVTYSETGTGGRFCDIVIDSNDYPRVIFGDIYKYKAGPYNQPHYSHDVGSGWITAERIPTGEGVSYRLPYSIEITQDDDVEVVYVQVGGAVNYRRRNSSWGTENTWTSTGMHPGGPTSVVCTSGGTIYRYAFEYTDDEIYENDSSTGLDATQYVSQCSFTAALSGTDRLLGYIETGTADVVIAYNEGTGWNEEVEQTGTYNVVQLSHSHNNNNYAADTIGYLFQATGSMIYYDEFTIPAGPTIHYAEAHLSGSGDLDADTLLIVLASGAMSGTGDLDAATLLLVLAAAAMSGAGDLDAVLERIVLDSATLTGSGDLSATGEAIVAAIAHLTGAGDLSATTALFVLASATISGIGDASATTLNFVLASASMSGVGDLTAAGGILLLGSATLSGTGDLSATLERIVVLSAALSGSGDLAAVPELLVISDASLAGAGDLSAIGERIAIGSASLSGAGDLSATTYLIVADSASLSGVGGLDATTLAIVLASATLSGVGDLSAICEVEGGGAVTGEAHLSGAGDLSASPYLLIDSTAALSGAGNLSAHGVLVFSGSAVLSGAGSMSATPQLIIYAIARPVEGFGDLSAAVQVIVMGAAVLSGYGDIYATCCALKLAQATLSGLGDLSCDVYIEGWEPVHRVYRPMYVNRVHIRADRTYYKEGD